MNKSLFFDIQLGASGDMLVGALLDLGISFEKMMEYLSKLNLSRWKISPEKITRYHISGTSANVRCEDEKQHRNLNDIQAIVNKADLPEKLINNIINIFTKLAQAEARVHGTRPDKIHFHEIGAVDSIIDISAFCILIFISGIEEIFYNEFPHGIGTIESSHGEIPVPVPAVVELTKNHESRLTDKVGELITPTAAAILTALGRQTKILSYTLLETGIGFGTREHPFPSYTRCFLIKQNNESKIFQLECNIDDMNPQLYPNIIEMLFDAGALDAYICAIIMKKGRPGNLLTVIAEDEKIEQIKKVIYGETTTLGLRILNVNREKLHRKYEKITVYGKEISMKVGYLNNKPVNVQPEFEDCKYAAKSLKKPIKEIMAEAIHEYKSIFSLSHPER